MADGQETGPPHDGSRPARSGSRAARFLFPAAQDTGNARRGVRLEGGWCSGDGHVPNGFKSDIGHGTLTSASRIAPPVAECEHPAACCTTGTYSIQEVLAALVSNPAV